MLFYFPWRNQQIRVYNCKILLHRDIDKIREWVISQGPDKDNSTHWWYTKLPADISYLYYISLIRYPYLYVIIILFIIVVYVLLRI